MEHYIPKIQELSNDKAVPKYATHLVYLTSANNPKEIEHKIIYSILNKKPKRADIYWFVHVDTMDDPYTCEYKVDHIIPNDIIRVDFRLGFRMEPRINLMFRKVVEDLVANKEVNIISRYESLASSNTVGDFQFMVMEKYLSQDNELPFFERVVMKIHFWLKEHSLSEERGFGLDAANVTVEKFPLIVAPVTNLRIEKSGRLNLVALQVFFRFSAILTSKIKTINFFLCPFLSGIFLQVLLVLSVAAYFLQEKFIFKPEKLKQDFQFKYDIPFREYFFDIAPGVSHQWLYISTGKTLPASSCTFMAIPVV